MYPAQNTSRMGTARVVQEEEKGSTKKNEYDIRKKLT